MTSLKSECRKLLKEVRNSVSKQKRYEKSCAIAQKLFSSPEYISAKGVMIYMSFGSEVETDIVFDRILADGKILAVPLCNVQEKTMTAYEVHGKENLHKGAYGILEPNFEDLKSISKSDIDLIIVPALGFDKYGYRLGYGAGYYDRYLDGYNGETVGLCFKECLVESVPHDKYDIKIKKILSD